MAAATSTTSEHDVVVVGAGLAGLAACKALHEQGTRFVCLEASDGVGGRVRTDVHEEGFLLDRGFQIFLTAYPECKAQLDYEALDLKPFYAGALVRWNGAFHRVADPFRHPVDGVLSLVNPIGSVADKVRVGLVRVGALLGSAESKFAAPETTIAERLDSAGFSRAMIERFFMPFLGGIFFDRQLGTTSRLFEFVMRMLALGANTLPARGIGAISDQLCAGLPEGSVRCNARVVGVDAGGATLADGSRVEARGGVVVAVEGPQAGALLGDALDSSPSKAGAGVGTACVYFAAPEAAVPEPVLFLDGSGASDRLVNNCCFPSEVAPSYAPAGQTLVSVSCVGVQAELSDDELAEAAKAELAEWFGAAATDAWRLLRVYRIPFSQPTQAPPTNLKRPVRLAKGVYVCGDHRYTATFDGAMLSGRDAAQAAIADLAQH
eukprot:CAMPEP_0170148044 /NCGR_PEP_ID=MMETSP0033_2-20121228/37101_1 /TAXON_ID=195969 /ORGANISM="Dolichomastix tenuilepis, Strain CCMP3274" /LENGTH=434 /DNA_ID=CAMNT_0010384901 /DNA_START=135 /DNA_END=1439 /DNA_ORIENTATION=+